MVVILWLLRTSFFVIVLNGCVSGQLSVTSVPANSVVIVKDSGGDIKTTGETPLALDLDESFFAQTDFVHLQAQKEGYVPLNFIIPKTFFVSNHSLNITLKKEENNAAEAFEKIDQCQQISKKSLNELGKGIAIAQSNMMKKEWQIASLKIDDLISNFPFVSVLYDLQGNIHYLKKNFDEALLSYEKSLAVDPQNVETAIMVRKLRKITGKSQDSPGGSL